MDVPPGSLGCQKIRKTKLKATLFSFSAKIQPKLKKKNHQKIMFFIVFRILFNLHLSAETQQGGLQLDLPDFLTPQRPRGHIHSEDIMVFVFVFDISEWCRPL